MKNQYFGDNRDLFKYDLILRIIKEIGSVNHFTFVPMLRPNMPDGEGTKREGEKRDRDKAKAGTGNEELKNFLDKFEDKSKRDIEQLKSFFKKHDIGMTMYYGKNKYFSHQQRQEYFEQLENELSQKSLVFVDPDIGLQVKITRDKHIKYSEVKGLYEHMDTSSILMIYQHFPRKVHQQYLNTRSKELKEKVAGDWPICIDDNEIIFFFLTKDKALRKSLSGVISDYGEFYRLRVGNT